MNNGISIRKRFVEHDFLFTKISNENPYITIDEIVSLLSEHEGSLCDVTFIFSLHSSGFKTKIIDNFTEYEIMLDDLTPFAMDFYYKQVTKLSVQQQKAKTSDDMALYYIQKIKNMINMNHQESVQYKMAQ
ncbi:hypothetical protein ACFQZE_07025 [Paenibacillus sp. GCM10027627]|uniref:hypothetical protein n=1 Tax=unclassified Paenibacillus TaxID=185978 RepID=UPI0036431CEE